MAAKMKFVCPAPMLFQTSAQNYRSNFPKLFLLPIFSSLKRDTLFNGSGISSNAVCLWKVSEYSVILTEAEWRKLCYKLLML